MKISFDRALLGTLGGTLIAALVVGAIAGRHGAAAAALVLASLGIYGVVSYSVSRRTSEIGIRMALGASPWNVRRRVIARTITLTAMGLAIGLAVSLLFSHWVAALLYGIAPTDGASFSAALAVLAGIALLAGYLPARRASRIDPLSALRTS